MRREFEEKEVLFKNISLRNNELERMNEDMQEEIKRVHFDFDRLKEKTEK